MRTESLLRVVPPIEVASLLGIKVQAVYQWGDVVPKLRQYEIRERLKSSAPEKLAAIESGVNAADYERRSGLDRRKQEAA